MSVRIEGQIISWWRERERERDRERDRERAREREREKEKKETSGVLNNLFQVIIT